MKLLFLTPQIPYPPRQGTALRNWGLISHLAQRHEVWLLAFADPLAPKTWPAELSAVCRNIATFPLPIRSGQQRLKTLVASNLPDMAWRLWSPEFAAQFQAWTHEQQFDIIQVEGIELARYAISAEALGLSPQSLGRDADHSGPRTRRPALVFDDHNCEYLMQKRWFERDIKNPRRWHAALYSLAQWRKLAAFERTMIQQAQATLCCSAEDRTALMALDPRFDPHIIFNGIDVDAYANAMIKSPNSKLKFSDAPPTLVFTGKMDFRPNIDAMLWFGSQVWPRIRQTQPHARWLIVGQKPSPRLDGLRADPNIEITGEVADPRPFIAQASVYIAPLRVGGGTRFKLMEAMALRKPIVTTRLGCEGFDIAPGREMMVADAPGDFAAAVIALLKQPEQAQAMTERAFAFVSQQYDWSVIVPKLEKIYERYVS